MKLRSFPTAGSPSFSYFGRQQGGIIGGIQGRKGDPGEPGPAGTGLQVNETVATYAELPVGLGSGDNGYTVVVQSDGLLYIWSGTAWPADGAGAPFRGEKGDQGDPGAPGSDGADGEDGAPGTPGADGADGNDGAAGNDGASAYEVAVEEGFVGDEAAFILSLKGEQGIQGVPGVDGDGAGDMVAAVYDPTSKAADAFSQDNMSDGTTNKNFTATEKTKLSGVATGATANDTDANLKARANHTGTQSADSITDGTTNKAYTATEKTKLAGVAAGAEVNVNADWTSVSGDSQILNKPTTFAPTIGSTSTTAVAGNDSRLTDTRTPTDNTVTSAKIVDGSIVDADINASAAIALSKLATGRVAGSNNGTAASLTVWVGTEAQYTAIGSKDASTLYFRTA